MLNGDIVRLSFQDFNQQRVLVMETYKKSQPMHLQAISVSGNYIDRHRD